MHPNDKSFKYYNLSLFSGREKPPEIDLKHVELFRQIAQCSITRKGERSRAVSPNLFSGRFIVEESSNTRIAIDGKIFLHSYAVHLSSASQRVLSARAQRMDRVNERFGDLIGVGLCRLPNGEMHFYSPLERISANRLPEKTPSWDAPTSFGPAAF